MTGDTAADAPRNGAAPAPRLATDGFRNAISLGVAAAVTLVSLVTYSVFLPAPFSDDTVTLAAFVFWIAYSAAFTALTHLTFARADGAALSAWMSGTVSDRERQHPRRVRFLGTGSGLNVQWSLLAILAVALVLVVPGLADSALANALAFGVVAAAWIVTVYSYAVHYARLDALESTFQFPGSGPPVFLDYLYLSGQLATTFSSSDVSVMTTRGRTVVTGQTMIAFVYSTFIIAILIGVLFLSS